MPYIPPKIRFLHVLFVAVLIDLLVGVVSVSPEECMRLGTTAIGVLIWGWVGTAILAVLFDMKDSVTYSTAIDGWTGPVRLLDRLDWVEAHCPMAKRWPRARGGGKPSRKKVKTPKLPKLPALPKLDSFDNPFLGMFDGAVADMLRESPKLPKVDTLEDNPFLGMFDDVTWGETLSH